VKTKEARKSGYGSALRDSPLRINRRAITPSPKAFTQKRNLAICSAVLVVVTVAAYSPVIKNNFVHYDDDAYITQNAAIRSGPTPAMLRWSLRSTVASNWHPLTWISHALDVRLFGLNPVEHHLHSLLLHAINTVLLLVLLTYATGFLWRSLAVAALFALHPLNVESVVWAAERKTVLSMLVFLLVITAYAWYARKPRWTRYLAVVSLFVLGLAAKPTVITLPFVLLLLDWWPLQRIQNWTKPRSVPQFPWTRLVLEKVPLLVLSAGSAMVTLIAQQIALNPVPFGIRVSNAIFGYNGYIGKTLWPLDLAAFYPLEAAPWSLTVLGLLLLFAISIFCWRQRFRRPWLIAGWLFYLGALIPVIGLVQVGAQAMADRYMYMPSLGLFVIGVWACAELFHNAAVAPRWRLATAVLVLSILAALTRRQVGFWRSNTELWTHALTVTDDNALAEDNLGVALLELNKKEEALAHFQNAARIAPTDPTSHINIAAELQDHGRLDEAIAQYQAALQSQPDNALKAIIYNNLGSAYRQQGDLLAAQNAYLEASNLEPQNADTAETTQRLGQLRIEMIIQQLRHQTSLHPSAAVYAQLGSLQQQLGNAEEARAAYTAALRLDPKLQSARQALLELPPRKP
jgi:protein O-mannosyl-transferase